MLGFTRKSFGRDGHTPVYYKCNVFLAGLQDAEGADTEEMDMDCRSLGHLQKENPEIELDKGNRRRRNDNNSLRQ